jgi:hypothetical protein
MTQVRTHTHIIALKNIFFTGWAAPPTVQQHSTCLAPRPGLSSLTHHEFKAEIQIQHFSVQVKMERLDEVVCKCCVKKQGMLSFAFVWDQDPEVILETLRHN